MTKPKVIVFSGAGLSAESGIPTYRAEDGMWEDHHIEDVATKRAWEREPARVWDFLEARRVSMAKAEPNEAHKALARLQDRYDVWNLTQNIDNLLERAGCFPVKHLHGRIGTFWCYGCQGTLLGPYRVCPGCGGSVRHHVVLFGERGPDMSYLGPILNEAEVFIGVGTSAVVEPAASLIGKCRKVPYRYWVDLDPPTHSHARKCLFLQGKASKRIPELVSVLLKGTYPELKAQNKKWALQMPMNDHDNWM